MSDCPDYPRPCRCGTTFGAEHALAGEKPPVTIYVADATPEVKGEDAERIIDRLSHVAPAEEMRRRRVLASSTRVDEHDRVMDPNDSMEDIFALRLHLLDEEHRRAQSPSARRRIEDKMREVDAERHKFREAAKVVDIALARWERDYDKTMEELAVKAGISVDELKKVKEEIARTRKAPLDTKRVKDGRRKPCPSTCHCLCHDTGGSDVEHPGRPCPGKYT